MQTQSNANTATYKGNEYFINSDSGKVSKKNVFFWETFPKSVYLPTHPRVFVRFGKTKGEIFVEKKRFSG